MTHAVKIFLVSLLLASVIYATTVEPIWLSPTNIKYDSPSDYTEQFPEQGVWTSISVGAGGRGEVPTVVMDSKKTLWIMHGTSQVDPDRIFPMTVWNYDPKNDLYRWVAGPANATANIRNPGELRVPSKDNYPGGVYGNRGTIDRNDNIWFVTSLFPQTSGGELWMFNTTSFMFTRMQGDASDGSSRYPVFGTQGVPSDDVHPGAMAGACFVTDSKNNLWLLSGSSMYSYTNAVWHFNTTSLQWTFINGNTTEDRLFTRFGDNPLYGGRSILGCDIDENDRVWLFGGNGVLLGQLNGDFSDMWSYDTRTNQWQLEYGSDANFKNLATIVSDDFNPGNMPPAKEGATMVDRTDGTLMVVCGGGHVNNKSDDSSWAAQNDVWLFNKTSKRWKLVYGDPFVGEFPGNFTHYRTPGSVMPGRFYHGAANGLNIDGEVFMYGGQNDPQYNVPFKDIWLIPRDRCTAESVQCAADEHCVNGIFSTSCQCNSCPPSAPQSRSTPSSSTVSSGLKLFASHLVFIFCSLLHFVILLRCGQQ